MSASVSQEDKLRETAAAWFVQARSERATEGQHKALAAWLTQSPHHLEAYVHIEQAVACVAALGPVLGKIAPPDSAPSIRVRHGWLRRRPARYLLAGVVLASMLLMVAVGRRALRPLYSERGDNLQPIARSAPPGRAIGPLFIALTDKK